MMGSSASRKVLNFTLFLALVHADIDADLNWDKRCAGGCSCHLGYYADLPIRQWMQQQEEKEKIRTPINEVYNEESFQDNVDKGQFLRQAMCILHTNADPQVLIQQLPEDTQALTILQGRGSEDITLEATHLKHFQQLIYLNIQGYSPNSLPFTKGNLVDNSLIISNTLFGPLTSLQYLNLQHINIHSKSSDKNEVHHEGYNILEAVRNGNNALKSFGIHEGRQLIWNTKGAITHQVFVTFNRSQNMLPYKMYREQKQARHSIFAGLTNLVGLRVIDCKLHEIYWEMFHGLNKIKLLSLEKNEILFLPEFAFYGTPHLKVLSLAHNKLLNIQSTALAGLLDLEILDLSNNNFSHLSEFSLPPFPNLQKAYLWHNPIEAVFSSTFEIMNDTKSLFIGSYLSPLELHPNSFHGLIHLNKLIVLNVEIEALENELLTGMPQLTYLKITGNISSISLDAFLDVPMLEILELQHCNIKTISLDAFIGLNKLIVLDLSNNLLDSLPQGVFEQLSSIQELHLQNNNLAWLPDGFFTTLSPKMVRLEGNLWHCTCDMQNWPASITNRVKEIKYIACKKNVCQYPSITYIYEKKVAPLCHRPEIYKGWNVYHVLRNVLQCSKTGHRKLQSKESIQKKYKQYEKNQKQAKHKHPSHKEDKYQLKNEWHQTMKSINSKSQIKVNKKEYIPSEKVKSHLQVFTGKRTSPQPAYNHTEDHFGTFKYANQNLKGIELNKNILTIKYKKIRKPQSEKSINHQINNPTQLKKIWKANLERKRQEKVT